MIFTSTHQEEQQHFFCIGINFPFDFSQNLLVNMYYGLAVILLNHY